MNNVQVVIHTRNLIEKYCKNCKKFRYCLVGYGTLERLVKIRARIWFQWVNCPDPGMKITLEQKERTYQECFLEASK